MKFSSFRGLLPAAMAAAGLSACAAPGPFPSLAPRAVEQEADAEPLPAPPTTPDQAVVSQVAALMATARQGNAAFDTAYRAAEQAAEGAGAAGSESWIEAQQALSRTEVARVPTVNAITALDRLALASAGQPANLEAVLAALEEAQAIAERQRSLIDQVQARLSAL